VSSQAGVRAYPLCTPNRTPQRFTRRHCQLCRGSPTWHPLLLASDADKWRAYSDPAVRRKLHEEVVEWRADMQRAGCARHWYAYLWVAAPGLEKPKSVKGQSVHELARAQGKEIMDAFLALGVAAPLETAFLYGANNVDKTAMAQILNSPNAIVGRSDGGAHGPCHGGYGYSPRLLGHWVREPQIMSLEQAVRRLTFGSASTFGIDDRGLLRPGMAADITIFDADTVNPLPEDVVHDFPAGGWRMRERAAGIHYTIVNGQGLLEAGRHTEVLPGRVLRNALCQTP
jgi:N-acyl-D-aspartate/D-glutamate deacylase